VTERDVPEELRREPVNEVLQEGGATIVRLAGQIDLHNAEPVRAALLEAADAGAERLVVDLEEVTFLDSTVLGILVEARARLAAGRLLLLLAAPGVEAQRALEVSGLDRHLAVYATVAEALAAASGP
jgi:anti-sigma B factor antagonist